jgi:hypothetical protein
VILLLAIAHAGPWVVEPGHFYAKGELSAFQGLSGGAPESSRLTYSELRAASYAEIGLPLKTHMTVYLPYIVGLNSGDDTRYVALSGGDAELGLTRAILDDSFRLSGEVRGRTPLYADRLAERFQTFGAYGGGFPVAGDGTTSIDGWLHAGSGFGGGWVQVSTGYRHRFAALDGVTYDGAIGLTPEIGWLGLGVAGVSNLGQDDLTRGWTAVRAFGAHKLAGITFAEATVAFLPAAKQASRGASLSLGVSAKR